MITRKLYKVPALYGRFTRLVGFDRGLGRFIRQLNLGVRADCRILDLACGSGVIGFELMEKYPKATLIATDLEASVIRAVETQAQKLGWSRAQVRAGLLDITAPRAVDYLDGTSEPLSSGSFDIVSVGGAMGHAPEREQALQSVLELVKPGGLLLNLEMNASPLGEMVSWLYHCRPLSLTLQRQIIEAAGFKCVVMPLSWRFFPANLTRLGVIARKT